MSIVADAERVLSGANKNAERSPFMAEVDSIFEQKLEADRQSAFEKGKKSIPGVGATMVEGLSRKPSGRMGISGVPHTPSPTTAGYQAPRQAAAPSAKGISGRSASAGTSAGVSAVSPAAGTPASSPAQKPAKLEPGVDRTAAGAQLPQEPMAFEDEAQAIDAVLAKYEGEDQGPRSPEERDQYHEAWQRKFFLSSGLAQTADEDFLAFVPAMRGAKGAAGVGLALRRMARAGAGMGIMGVGKGIAEAEEPSEEWKKWFPEEAGPIKHGAFTGKGKDPWSRQVRGIHADQAVLGALGTDTFKAVLADWSRIQAEQMAEAQIEQKRNPIVKAYRAGWGMLGPMSESWVRSGFGVLPGPSQLASFEYWRDQGAGRIIAEELSKVDVDQLSPEQIQEIRKIALADGATYAAIEFASFGYLKGMGFRPGKKAAGPILRAMAGMKGKIAQIARPITQKSPRWAKWFGQQLVEHVITALAETGEEGAQKGVEMSARNRIRRILRESYKDIDPDFKAGEIMAQSVDEMVQTLPPILAMGSMAGGARTAAAAARKAISSPRTEGQTGPQSDTEAEARSSTGPSGGIAGVSPSSGEGVSAPTIETAPAESAAAGQEVVAEPTEPQKEAGNYKKAHVKLDGHDITIENPVGFVRKGKDKNGKAWVQKLASDYGYIKGTAGYDKDHLDVFIKPGYKGEGETVFVVNQVDPSTGRFDEHKVVFGAADQAEAEAIYLSNYEKGWKGFKSVVPMAKDTFKEWARGEGPKKGELHAQEVRGDEGPVPPAEGGELEPPAPPREPVSRPEPEPPGEREDQGGEDIQRPEGGRGAAGDQETPLTVVPAETFEQAGNTHSAATIPDGKIKKPFTHGGKEYVVTGSKYSPDGDTHEAYELVPAADFDGETYSYQDKLETGEKNYHGVEVSRGGKDYVLQGPPVTFAEGAAEAAPPTTKGLDDVFPPKEPETKAEAPPQTAGEAFDDLGDDDIESMFEDASGQTAEETVEKEQDESETGPEEVPGVEEEAPPEDTSVPPEKKPLTPAQRRHHETLGETTNEPLAAFRRTYPQVRRPNRDSKEWFELADPEHGALGSQHMRNNPDLPTWDYVVDRAKELNLVDQNMDPFEALRYLYRGRIPRAIEFKSGEEAHWEARAEEEEARIREEAMEEEAADKVYVAQMLEDLYTGFLADLQAGVDPPEALVASFRPEYEKAWEQIKDGVHATQLSVADLRKLTSTKGPVFKSHGIKLYDTAAEAQAALAAVGQRAANEKMEQYLKRLREYQKTEAPAEIVDGFTEDDIRFLIERVEEGQIILVGATGLGIPTIHDQKGANHMGFGVFRATTSDYEVTFEGGGAMSRTPSGRGYTVVGVNEGTFPYDREGVLKQLRSLLPDNLADAKKHAKKAGKAALEGLDAIGEGLSQFLGKGKAGMGLPLDFDQETYQNIKPLFEAALKHFEESGMEAKEALKAFFRWVAEQKKKHGWDIDPVPYLKHFRDDRAGKVKPPEEKQDTAPSADLASAPSIKAAQEIAESLKEGAAVSKPFLMRVMARHFGGSMAAKKFSIKDAYDAMEAGVNLFLKNRNATTPTVALPQDAVNLITAIREQILALIPTQTNRTLEQDQKQQFSTPPTHAFAANWVANLQAGDVYLEPSAGLGGIAVFARIAGVKQIIANELSGRRADILEGIGIADKVYRENAELMDAILEPKIQSGEIGRPTVVVMNPPFSNAISGRKGMIVGTGHVGQALTTLAPGGRLVAIIGGPGRYGDSDAVKAWFRGLQQKYHFRANVIVSGKEYRKYGTSFENRIIVIDKPLAGESGGTVEPIEATVQTVEELIPLLQEIRDERNTSAIQQSGGGATGGGGAGSAGVSGGTGGTRTPGVGPESPGQSDEGGGSGRPPRGSQRPGQRPGSRQDQGDGDTSGHTGRPESVEGSESDQRGDRGDLVEKGEAGAKVEKAEQEQREVKEGLFDDYQPAISIEGAVAHPTKLVESAAMAAVRLPDVNYTPNIPRALIQDGVLSIAQLEFIACTGQAHGKILTSGERRGMFGGDGTGVGKGREIVGVILDNWRQGRQKAVWVSENNDLFKDAYRDSDALGLGEELFAFGTVSRFRGHKREKGIRAKVGRITRDKGILFATYAVLGKGNTGFDDQGNYRGYPNRAHLTRLQQIADWVGKDFDGVIAFDESHNAANNMDSRGNRGTKKAAQRALAVVDLQKLLPKARILYMSATGATELMNFGYAERLGVWGPGTAFSDKTDFIAQVQQGGVSAMEIVARDLKAMGLYMARTLSFEGTEFADPESTVHELTPEQGKIYNSLAGAWHKVMHSMEHVMEVTGQAGNGNAKGRARSMFFGAEQRFFNQLLSALQMPSIIADAEKQLAAGNSVVLQLVNHNEAILNRELQRIAEEEGSIDDLDLTTRSTLLDYVNQYFPTFQYVEEPDQNGNMRWVVARDSEGNPIHNPEALREKQKILDQIATLAFPTNPVEMILNTFGADNVAEITGRSQRVIMTEDEFGNMVATLEKRTDAMLDAEANDFNDGKRRILLFSQKGGTGRSYHSDLTIGNQQRRVHYVVQAGWRADKVIQGLGRTHRSNQAVAPMYQLWSTNIKGHKRFISTVARRLAQLGALTSGERRTAGQGLFSTRDNIDSTYGNRGLTRFIHELFRGDVEGMAFDTVMGERLGFDLSRLVDEEDGSLNEENLPNVGQFMNRILALPLDEQSSLFEAFLERMDAIIAWEKEHDLYDPGTQTYKADRVEIRGEEVVHTHEESKAETKVMDVDAINPIHFTQFDDLPALGSKPILKYVRNLRSGYVFALRQGPDLTEKSGSVRRTYRRYGIKTIDTMPMDDFTVATAEEAEAPAPVAIDTFRVGKGRIVVTFDRVLSPSQSEGILEALKKEGFESERGSHETTDARPLQSLLITLKEGQHPVTKDQVAELANTAVQDAHRKLLKGKFKYAEVAEDEARAMWDTEIEAADKFHTKKETFVIGTFLPIWDRISGAVRRVRMFRFKPEGRSAMLGALVKQSDVAGVKRNLGATGEGQLSPEDAYTAIMDDDMMIRLANGWSIMRKRIAGEARIEVVGPNFHYSKEFEDYIGGFVERISFKPRFFISTEKAEAAESLTKIFAKSPVVAVSERPSGGAAAGGRGDAMPSDRVPSMGQAEQKGKQGGSQETDPTSIGGAEAGQAATGKPGEPFKLFERSKALVKKYANRVGEGRLPRGTAGVFYPETGNVFVNALNNIFVAVHETTHAAERKTDFMNRIMRTTGVSKTGNPIYDPGTRYERSVLTEIYVDHYPGGSKKHKLVKRMREGVATFIQKYIEQPTMIGGKYPGLVRMFLEPGGRYYYKELAELAKEARAIVDEYQSLDALSQIGARVTHRKQEVDKRYRFLTLRDKVTRVVFDAIAPIEKLARVAGRHMTPKDPSLWLREHKQIGRIFAHNTDSHFDTTKMRFTETYTTLVGGKYVEVFEFNWKTIIDRLHKMGTVQDFSHYLVARRQHFAYVELDERQVAAEEAEETLREIKAARKAGEIMIGAKDRIEKAVAAIQAYRELKAILKKDNFDRETVDEAYEAHRERFEEHEKMFDALVQADLDLLASPEIQLVTPTARAEYLKNEGYATFKRDIFNEIIHSGGETPHSTVTVGAHRISSLIRRKGSELTIIDPLFMSIVNHSEILRKGSKQIVYNKIGDLAPELPGVFQREQLKVVKDQSTGRISYPQEKDRHIIMARQHYKRVPFQTSDEIMGVMNDVLSAQNVEFLERFVTATARVFTKSTTGLYIAFAPQNLIVDQVTASAQTRTNYIPVLSQLQQIYDLLRKDDRAEAEYLREYLNLAGTRQTFVGWMDMTPEQFHTAIRREHTALKKAWGVIESGASILAVPSAASELLTRATEYIKARKNGEHQIVALEMAGRVSAPFHHRGSWGGRFGRTWISGLPYFNAALQVLHEYSSTLGDPKRRNRAIFVTAALMSAHTGAMLVLMGMGSDDQKKKYADLEPGELSSYVILPHPNGIDLLKFRIPEQMAPFSTVMNMAMAERQANADYRASEYLDAITSWIPDQMNITAPIRAFLSWMPQVLRPASETIFNKRTYPRIRDLESQGTQRRFPRPGDRVYRSTSAMAKVIGDQLNISPIKVDHLIEGYLGRSIRYVTGKRGFLRKLINPFLREAYFGAGRKVQSFYHAREQLAVHKDQMKHSKRRYKSREKRMLKDDERLIKETEKMLSAYRKLDTERDRGARRLRAEILDNIDALSPMVR